MRPSPSSLIPNLRDRYAPSGEAGRSGPREAATATSEKLKGGLKSVVGTVTGNDDLRREGDVQQDKAARQASAAKEEAKAAEQKAAEG